MRIALITAAYPPEGANGGLASFYFELARALVDAGHDVLVGTLTTGADEDVQNGRMRVVRRHFDDSVYSELHDLDFVPGLAYCLPRAIELYRKLETVVTNFQPDVIECAEHGAQGLLWAATRQFPLTVRCICPQFYLMESGWGVKSTNLDLNLIKSAETYVLEQADALTAPSLNLAEIISKGTGEPVERFAIIPNPLSESERSARSAEIFPEGAFPRLLFVGRIEPLKGADLLVEMLPAVVAAYPDAHLSFVGSEVRGTGSEKSYADGMRERLKEMELCHKTTFVGLVQRSDVQALQHSADLCLFPSRYDSSPYACLEAMRIGNCVIASDVGGIPEYITHGQTGWLVKPNDGQAFAEAVVHLARNADLRSRLSRAGAAEIQNKCSPGKVAAQSVSLYKQAVSNFAKVRTGKMPSSLEFLLLAFDSYCTGSHFAGTLAQAYKKAGELGWHEGYAAGVLSEQAKHKQAARSLMKSLLARVKRLARLRL